MNRHRQLGADAPPVKQELITDDAENIAAAMHRLFAQYMWVVLKIASVLLCQHWAMRICEQLFTYEWFFG